MRRAEGLTWFPGRPRRHRPALGVQKGGRAQHAAVGKRPRVAASCRPRRIRQPTAESGHRPSAPNPCQHHELRAACSKTACRAETLTRLQA